MLVRAKALVHAAFAKLKHVGVHRADALPCAEIQSGLSLSCVQLRMSRKS